MEHLQFGDHHRSEERAVGEYCQSDFSSLFLLLQLNTWRTKEEKTKEASVPNGLPVTEISEGYTKVKMEEK